MKSANTLSPGTEDTIATGVRETTSPADAAAEPSETLSGRESYPAESWAADEDPETELPVPAGELIGGKYSVERIFAAGGMGIVCLGRHVQLDQPVAIKFLRRALSGRPSIVERFLNEARALAALRSEHVVRVMDVGQLASGRPYLVMEHLDGSHLDALLEREGALRIETAVRYVLQVCETLSEAHALGIVHRDIKPENLFLWSGGPNQDSVKVLDFGLAKQLGSSKALGITGPQDSLGSPSYMSPEQITTPQLVDSRTDIWSLGVVLYRQLTNTLPFDGNNLVEVLSHILNATPQPLPDVLPSLDAELDAIVHRCLERDPAARYQSMAQLSEALNGYLVERQRLVLDEDDGAVAPASLPPPKKPAKVRIPGVHSRWPAVAVGLVVLLGAGIFEANRTGRIRLRDITDGWLTTARLGADTEQPARRPSEQQTMPLIRGLGLRAVPESERPSSAAAGRPQPLPAAAAAVESSDQERAGKEAAYRDYLKSEGLTPLNEAAPTPDNVAPAPPSDAPDP